MEPVQIGTIWEQLTELQNKIEQNIYLLEAKQATAHGIKVIDRPRGVAKAPISQNYEELEEQIGQLRYEADCRMQERNSFREYAVPAIQDLLGRCEEDQAAQIKRELHTYTVKAMDAKDAMASRIEYFWILKSQNESVNLGNILQTLRKLYENLGYHIEKEKDGNRRQNLFIREEALEDAIKALEAKILQKQMR